VGFFQLSFLESLFKPRPLKGRKAPTRTPPQAHACAASLTELWQRLAHEYFPGQTEILLYKISWSRRRQKRTLASCNIRQQRVVVAQELNHEEHFRWLPALLYHEMCHAAIGMAVQRGGSKRLWHGAQFRALERRHPEIHALDIWIKSGGWQKAIRSARARSAAATRLRNTQKR
jgi:hypothetical protein